MATATLTSKGQVTLPVQIRSALNLGIGDRIEFIETAVGQYTLMAAIKSIQNLKGMIRKMPKPVSIEKMNAAIAEQGQAAR